MYPKGKFITIYTAFPTLLVEQSREPQGTNSTSWIDLDIYCTSMEVTRQHAYNAVEEGDLTVAVEANMHHGCRGRVARLVVGLPPPEEVRGTEAWMEDEIL